jgi:hypothetical protein
MVVTELSNILVLAESRQRSLMKGHTLWFVEWSDRSKDIFHSSFACLSSLQIPFIEMPIDYDVRAKPRSIASLTGTKGESL